MKKENDKHQTFAQLKQIGVIAGIAIVAVLILLLLTTSKKTGMFFFLGEQEKYEPSELKEFNDCLYENGMVIYGMEWCPLSNNLVNTLGGEEAVERIYVDCGKPKNQHCERQVKTGSLPEIQIDGELYRGEKSLEGFAEATGCDLAE